MRTAAVLGHPLMAQMVLGNDRHNTKILMGALLGRQHIVQTVLANSKRSIKMPLGAPLAHLPMEQMVMGNDRQSKMQPIPTHQFGHGKTNEKTLYARHNYSMQSFIKGSDCDKFTI